MGLKKRLLVLANAVIAPVGVALYHRGANMESTLQRMSRWNADIGTVIDLGAADGEWSKLALAAFPQARVIGVDPLQERDRPLGALKRASGGRYDYVLAAAGPSDGGTVEMGIPDGDLDSSTVNATGGATRSVPVRSVDAMVTDKGLKGPFFLKFDTHGFEVPILEGATATLAQTNYIVMEAYNYRHVDGTLLFHEMIALLETKGFRVFNLVDVLNRPDDGALWQIDLFFARADDPIFANDQYRA